MGKHKNAQRAQAHGLTVWGILGVIGGLAILWNFHQYEYGLKIGVGCALVGALFLLISEKIDPD